MSSIDLGTIYDERVVREYLSFYGQGEDAFESLLIFSAAETMRRGGVLLDVGCGPGIFLDWVSLDPVHYLGLDASEAMVAEARRLHPDHSFMHLAFEDWHYDRAYDMVLGGFGPLMHVPDLEPFARALKRALAPGGYFLLMAAGEPGQHVRILDGKSPETIYHSPAALVEAFGGTVHRLGSLLVVTNA